MIMFAPGPDKDNVCTRSWQMSIWSQHPSTSWISLLSRFCNFLLQISCFQSWVGKSPKILLMKAYSKQTFIIRFTYLSGINFTPKTNSYFATKLVKHPLCLLPQSSKTLQRYVSHTSDIMKLRFKGKSIFVNVSWAKACSGKRRSDTNYKYYSQGKKVQICKK